MRIIRHHLGVRFGGFTDTYEVLTNCSRERACQRFEDFFVRHGGRNMGRAYDGAVLFELSPWHEVAVYLRKEQIDIEDRFKTRFWFRLGPSWLRRHLPCIVKSLHAEAPENEMLSGDR